MNIAACAQILLSYFAPEERGYPTESVTYPDRHAAVRKALNDALQYLFGKGGAWVRKDERGHLVHAPAQVPIIVENGSKQAVIAEADWQDWFAGCSIVIEGSSVENRIRNASRNVTLKYPHDGASSIITYGSITVAGTDISPVTLLYAGVFNGRPMWSATGAQNSSSYTKWDGTQWVVQLTVNPPPSFYILKWTGTGDTETPDLCSAWEQVFVAPGMPMESGTPELASPLVITDTTATIYHDSVSVDPDVLEVLRPVFLNRRPLAVRAQPADMGRLTAGDDFPGECQTDPPLAVPAIAQTAATPTQFAVETWGPGDENPALLRIRLYPAPAANGFLDFRSFIAPPVIADITAAADLPIPFAFVESVFLPIAVKKLKSCPFWRGIVSDQQVEDGFAAALEQLREAAPKQTGGTRIVPKY